MYACMHTIYTRKNCTVEVEGKPIKELQVKCESEKIPEADSGSRDRS